MVIPTRLEAVTDGVGRTLTDLSLGTTATATATASASASVPAAAEPSDASPPLHPPTSPSLPPPTNAPLPRTLTLLYATETGTSHSLAETLYATALRKRFASVRLVSLDAYDPRSLVAETLVVFLVSTAGQGDFPAAARSFWTFLLRDGLPRDVLEGVRFAAFGLGDSTYPRFNWPVRKLRRRLVALGAEEVVEHGEGDEMHYLGIDGTLLPWLDGLWKTLNAIMPLPPGVQEIPEDQLLPPKIGIRFVSEEEQPSPSSPSSTGQATPVTSTNGTKHTSSISNGQTTPSIAAAGLGDPPPGSTWAVLTRNDRITDAAHFQDVRHITFRSLSSEALAYNAGDVVSIYPSNPAADVSRLIDRLSWTSSADRPLVLVPSSPSHPLPPTWPRGPTTLRILLTYHLDPFSVPRRSFFDFIRRFSPADSLEREKLDEFCTPGEGAEEMYEYAQRVRRTMVEVLDEFQTVQVGCEWVCELFPMMRERAFSIASAPQTSPSAVTLAVAMLTYKTRLHAPRWGICSKYLSTLSPGSIIPIRFGRGTMTLPPSHRTPVILVGPGTGVAPLRSFLHARIVEAYEAYQSAGREGGEAAAEEERGSCENLVFVGCRYQQKDWIFGEELERLDRDSPKRSGGGFSDQNDAFLANGTADGPSAVQPNSVRHSKRGTGLKRVSVGSLDDSAPSQNGRNDDDEEAMATAAQKARTAGVITRVYLAASRDSEDKVYVQHRIRQQAAEVWDVVGRRAGWVYVCGSSGKMPTDVREAVKFACTSQGGMTEEQAERYLLVMEQRRRWQEECWS